MHKAKIERAKTLLEALPYIKQFQEKIVVIKLGGSLMTDAALTTRFAQDVALLQTVGMKPVVVHGGGKEVTQWMKAFGKDTVFIDGLRYTDSDGMAISEMVLAGKVNKSIVSLLNRTGARAVGLSGRDAGLFTAVRTLSPSGQDLGFVGEVDNVSPEVLHTLLSQQYIPVISSIGESESGQALNLNADGVASAIGQALGAEKLLYITDVDGLIINKTLQSELSLAAAEGLMSHADVKGGMLPKLSNCILAVKNGIHQVHMINGTIEHAVLLELFTDGGIGTMISSGGVGSGQ